MKTRVSILAISLLIIVATISGLYLVSADNWHLSEERVHSTVSIQPPVADALPAQHTKAELRAAEKQQSPAKNDLSDLQLNPREAIRSYHNTPNAIQAQKYIDSLRFKGLDTMADWAERDLAIKCRTVADLAAAKYEPANNWAFERQSEYCLDWSPTPRGQNTPELQNRVEGDSLSRSDVSKLLRDTNPIDRPDLVSDMVKSAVSPNEIRYTLAAVAELLANSGEVVNVGQDAQLQFEDFEIALATASEILGCQLFNGCGSESMNFLAVCSQTTTCQPNMTVLDLLAMHVSPYQWDQATSIRDFLLSPEPGG
jgi:hypothetical protein